MWTRVMQFNLSKQKQKFWGNVLHTDRGFFPRPIQFNVCTIFFVNTTVSALLFSSTFPFFGTTNLWFSVWSALVYTVTMWAVRAKTNEKKTISQDKLWNPSINPLKKIVKTVLVEIRIYKFWRTNNILFSKIYPGGLLKRHVYNKIYHLPIISISTHCHLYFSQTSTLHITHVCFLQSEVITLKIIS